jgi:EAL domain-containing protein (putative c-di-GMP-specific phosphodiesterase class I)
MLETPARLQGSATSSSQEWSLCGRLAEEMESQTFAVCPLPFVVGRRSGLSLTLPRQTVSGAHAELFERDQRLFVRDLGSTNGAFVNGQRLSDEHELKANDLVQFADAPFRVTRSQPDVPSQTRWADTCDQALAIVQFDRLLSGRSLDPHFQPIVDLKTGGLVAFEGLARSRLIGLETPNFMFTAAALLDAAAELSRVMRRVSVEASGQLPAQLHLFLNTHPSELNPEAVLKSCLELRQLAPHQTITIEIHEAAMTNVEAMTILARGLEDIDMTLAFDDFGAGQARIAELAEVRPHYIKFDRCIVRQLHLADASRRRVVGGLVGMVSDVGVVPVAEGVETADERDACLELGFVLAQGYYFGKPMPAADCQIPSPR